MSAAIPERDEPSLTSVRVRAAIAGNEVALGWVVIRFSPLLLAKARNSLRTRGLALTDIEDVVADAWVVALPKLNGFDLDDRRVTPRLVRFLSTIVDYRVLELLRPSRITTRELGSADGSAIPSTRGERSEVLSQLIRDEAVTHVLAAIDRLDPIDRDVVVLRLLEGCDAKETGQRLSISADAVHTRLFRAIARLRAQLPASVFDELTEDAP